MEALSADVDAVTELLIQHQVLLQHCRASTL